MMKISYKLVRRTRKTEKFEKSSEIYIINLKTIRYKMTVLDNIIPSVLNYRTMRPVRNLRLPKNKKK